MRRAATWAGIGVCLLSACGAAGETPAEMIDRAVAMAGTNQLRQGGELLIRKMYRAHFLVPKNVPGTIAAAVCGPANEEQPVGGLTVPGAG